MFQVLVLATLLLIAVTVLPLYRHPHWTIRGLDFPRLQFVIFAVVLLVAQGHFLDLEKVTNWTLPALVVTCLLWHLSWIAPYTRLWPSEVNTAGESTDDRRLSILTANVLMTNRNSDALLALIKKYKPDIVLTLESDQWWQDRLDTLETDMPHTIKCPLDNLYGMHLYSRLPLQQSEISYLVQKDVPSLHALVELRCGSLIRIHCLHPAPPSPSENPESAERDAELIIVARSVAESDHQSISDTKAASKADVPNPG